MSIRADSIEVPKKQEKRERKCDPECDGFPDDKSCTTLKAGFDRRLDGIIRDKHALLWPVQNGTTNLHRLATYNSDPTVIGVILDTLRNGNNFMKDSSPQNSRGHSPLFVAILCRNKTFALQFIEAGAPLNLRDNFGKTIFHYLAEKNSEYFTHELFRDFTFHRDEIAPTLHCPDNEGLTAAHIAFQAGNMDAFQKFYDYGGVQLLRKKDQRRGYTLLHMAAERGDREMAGFLIENKQFQLGVDEMGADEATPLHLAVSHGHIELVEYLLDKGADAALPLRECSVLGLIPYECETRMRALFAKRIPRLYTELSEYSDNFYGDSSDDENDSS